jgi:predicted lactoylglutathione lyase
MTLPQRINYITLGARDMVTLREFYAAMGWRERPGSSDDFATYEVGASLLALYPLGRLSEEAAPGEQPPAASGWNGITLGVNVESPQTVDQAVRTSVAAGARVVASPVKREWGGYSGYISDPEGNRWEIAWAPEA